MRWILGITTLIIGVIGFVTTVYAYFRQRFGGLNYGHASLMGLRLLALAMLILMVMWVVCGIKVAVGSSKAVRLMFRLCIVECALLISVLVAWVLPGEFAAEFSAMATPLFQGIWGVMFFGYSFLMFFVLRYRLSKTNGSLKY
jgi:hypothetical protein